MGLCVKELIKHYLYAAIRWPWVWRWQPDVFFSLWTCWYLPGSTCIVVDVALHFIVGQEEKASFRCLLKNIFHNIFGFFPHTSIQTTTYSKCQFLFRLVTVTSLVLRVSEHICHHCKRQTASIFFVLIHTLTLTGFILVYQGVQTAEPVQDLWTVIPQQWQIHHEKALSR